MTQIIHSHGKMLFSWRKIWLSKCLWCAVHVWLFFTSKGKALCFARVNKSLARCLFVICRKRSEHLVEKNYLWGYLNFEPGFELGFEPGSEPGSELGSEPGSEWGSEPGFEPGFKTDPGSTPLRTQTVSRHKFSPPFWSCDLFFLYVKIEESRGERLQIASLSLNGPFVCCLVFQLCSKKVIKCFTLFQTKVNSKKLARSR